MVVKCLLCLESPTIPGPKFLEIFGEEGMRLGISSIINKHFWLKTNRNNEDVQQVCLTCWEVVRDFHILYQRVEDAHKYLEVKTIELDDPLPQDVMPKSEDDQDPIMGDNGLGDPIFDPEIKVEVHDLDLLPQIEILESANVPERVQRTGRRGRQPGGEQSPKISAKRIKKEQSPAADTILFDFGSDENLKKGDLIASGSLEDPGYTHPSNSVDKEESTSKKKSRTRKSNVGKAKATTTRAKRSKKLRQEPLQTADPDIKSEKEVEEQPSCSNAQLVSDITEEATIKMENPAEEQNANDFVNAPESFEDDDAYAQDDFDEDNDNDNYTKESDDSSESESEGEESEGSDWNESKKKNEKFAVITKKERNVPKKYKKREKPATEPKRLSREEIEARQAQQAEYDAIITKFFEKIRCPKCELLVHTFGEMRAHFRSDHGDDHGFIECCGRRFGTRKFLAEHIMVHYNPDHFKCKTCDKVCRDSTQLESHEQTHLPNPPPSKYKKTFQCEKCSKTFSSKASFEHHMVAKHVPREEFKFECPECKKNFPTKKKFRVHMVTHDPRQIQICSICGKSFKNKTNARTHERNAHTDYKPEPQQCTICNTWYTTIGGLRHHMRNIHDSTGKEHRCHICDHVSTTRIALRRHITLNHVSRDRFKCNLCGKGFSRALYLKEHKATHTGEALYACPHCPTTFAHSSNVYKHLKKVHKAEFAIYKQQETPEILKRTLKVAEKVDTKRNSTDSPISRTNEELVISSHIVISTEKNATLENEIDSTLLEDLE